MTQDRTMMAAALICGYGAIIAYIDNYVRVIAAEAGLAQFHLTRTFFALAFLTALSLAFGLRMRPKSWGRVAARSFIHASAMFVYFGALAFLPVAVVAAGLFTAPIFVLLIQRVAYGRPVTLVQGVAVAAGFGGVVMVLGPDALGAASLASILPVAAGALYALGNMATREWCEGEEAATLLAGFFSALGVIGACGMVALALIAPDVPAGTDGFVLRGPVWPSGTFIFWVVVQAAGSLIGVGLMIRAYQITDAAKASVMEYVILPFSALWSWALWGEVLTPLAAFGMVLIFIAGAVIALWGRKAA